MDSNNANQSAPKASKPLFFAVLAVIVLIVLGYAILYKKAPDVAVENTNKGVVDSPNTSATQTVTVGEPTPGKAVTYKDGVYTVVGGYRSPGGLEEIGVSLTLKDGVIIAATVEPKATLPKSQNFQKMFEENYKTFVIGKSITDLQLMKVSGSSLTPKGFNDALEKVKAQAKVS